MEEREQQALERGFSMLEKGLNSFDVLRPGGRGNKEADFAQISHKKLKTAQFKL